MNLYNIFLQVSYLFNHKFSLKYRRTGSVQNARPYSISSNFLFSIHQIIFCAIIHTSANTYTKNAVIEDVADAKQLKKIFRTKNNVLVLFVSTARENAHTIKTFRDAAEFVKGQGTMIMIDCSNSDGKKMCKKLKVSPQPFVLKHYKDGDFNKDYDRQMAVSSILNFMKDPTGDLPWEEDPNSTDVMHIQDAKVNGRLFHPPLCVCCAVYATN